MNSEINNAQYDVAIIGGGLAGLALSIQLSRLGHKVVLCEKEQYPYHKVCGEYISLESWDFLSSLGLDVEHLHPSKITELEVSAPNGKLLKQKLPLGGFGISRYLLDDALAAIAVKSGVMLHQKCRVENVLFEAELFSIGAGSYSCQAKIVCCSYGKKSNLDVKWKRRFVSANKNKLNNYVGVKYHIKTQFPADTIALHNFHNGYCGIVKIEADKYCLCYLTNAANLQQYNGDIREMETNILCGNPFLKKIFSESEFFYQSPLTISQISFDKKEQVEEHMLMIGDAAGMITPLCGNGMSMALHGSKIAGEAINDFLENKISRPTLEKTYAIAWRKHFSKRLFYGRMIQKLFGAARVTNISISLLTRFPKLTNFLIKRTHGKPF